MICRLFEALRCVLHFLRAYARGFILSALRAWIRLIGCAGVFLNTIFPALGRRALGSITSGQMFGSVGMPHAQNVRSKVRY